MYLSDNILGLKSQDEHLKPNSSHSIIKSPSISLLVLFLFENSSLLIHCIATQTGNRRYLISVNKKIHSIFIKITD